MDLRTVDYTAALNAAKEVWYTLTGADKNSYRFNPDGVKIDFSQVAKQYGMEYTNPYIEPDKPAIYA